MKKTVYSIMALAGMTLMGVRGAFADVTVNYKITGSRGVSSQTIQYADDQHVRIDMRDGRKVINTMIKLGDKVYAITDGNVIEMTGGPGSPALYPQIMPQSPCTRLRPRRGAQIMVIPLASAATQV